MTRPKDRPLVSAQPYHRAQLYGAAFPKHPPLSATMEWLTGTWAIGANWANENPLYGAYPRGYLKRVHAMFPGVKRVLHVFSGGLTFDEAVNMAWPGMQESLRQASPFQRDLIDHGGVLLPVDYSMELVDLKGPDEGRCPTWMGDILTYCDRWQVQGQFDLILADPPYSAEDAKKYGTTMPNRGAVTRALRQVAKPGATLVWLDQVWPMHRKDEWRTWGQVGLVRSTNHRVRLVSLFEAV